MGAPKVKKRKIQTVWVEASGGSQVFSCAQCGRSVRLEDGMIITCATCKDPHVVCERCFRTIKQLEGWD